MKTSDLLKQVNKQRSVDDTVSDYIKKFEDEAYQNVDERLLNAAEINKDFYNLVTDFYLHAWGKMFHFGVRYKGDSFEEALKQHEIYLADKLELNATDKCLDIGCGVGGPMMNLAAYSKAEITGINNNEYQIGKGLKFVNQANLQSQCSFMNADWMKVPMEDSSFDKAYSIEASCHAADNRPKLFKEINRLLKPGALFGGYEWVLTDNYDPNNAEHRKIKYEIELGNGLANLNFKEDVVQALESAGFEVLECGDRAEDCDPETPWHLPLKGESSSLKMIRMSKVGRLFMRGVFITLESLGILPKGTLKVSKMLNLTGEAMVRSGDQKLFTPMLFFLARKR